MKEIKRYKLVATESARNVIESSDGHWVHYSNVEQLQARIKELESAERTLISLGYENKGGEMWKPSIGKRPNFNLIDSLNERIKELESDAHINEIKAQGIDEFIKNCPPYERNMGALDDGTMVTWHCYNIHHLTNYIEKLRARHD